MSVTFNEDKKKIEHLESIVESHEMDFEKKTIKVIKGRPYLYSYTSYKGKTVHLHTNVIEGNYNSSYDWRSEGRISTQDYIKYFHNRLNRNLIENIRSLINEYKDMINVIILLTENTSFQSEKEEIDFMMDKRSEYEKLDEEYFKLVEKYEKELKKKEIKLEKIKQKEKEMYEKRLSKVN